MDPKKEMNCFDGRNSISSGNLKQFCRMLRAWKYTNNVLMSGILLDTTAYWFFREYQYADESYSYYDWMSRDYFKYLLDHAEDIYWERPGETGYIKREYTIKYDANYAYEKVLKALEDHANGYSYCWHQDWRDIYGSKFPES